MKTREMLFQLHLAQAQWWIASATSGHVAARTITSMDGVPWSDERKVAYAMDTAQTHIHLAREVLDADDGPNQ